jgi:hypothetical protein
MVLFSFALQHTNYSFLFMLGQLMRGVDNLARGQLIVLLLGLYKDFLSVVI